MVSGLAAYSRVVTNATLQLGEPRFAETLGTGIQESLVADDGSLIRYHESGAPTIEYTLPPKRRGATTLDRYVKWPFLLDPFLSRCRDRKSLWCFQAAHTGTQWIQRERIFSHLVSRVWFFG